MSEKGQDSRERILQAALRVGAERGYDGLTISLITARAGLPASSVYWHFADKDTLVAEAVQYGYDAWRASTPVSTIGVGASFEEAVRERLAFSAQSLIKRPEFWHVGVLLSLQRRETAPAALSRFRTIHAELVAQLREWYVAVLPASVGDDQDLIDDLVQFHLTAVGGLYATAAATPAADLALLMDHIAAAIIALVQRSGADTRSGGRRA